MSTERVPTPLIPVTGTTLDSALEIKKAGKPRTLDHLNRLVHQAAGNTSSLRVFMCVFPQEQTALTYLELITGSGKVMLLTPNLVLNPEGEKAPDGTILARLKTASSCIEKSLPCEHEIDPLKEKLRLATLFPSAALEPISGQLNRLFASSQRHSFNSDPDLIKILTLYPHTSPDLDLVAHAQARNLVFEYLPKPLH